MQRVADLLGEVDDGVAADDQVVAAGGTGMRSRSPISKRTMRRSSGLACQPPSGRGVEARPSIGARRGAGVLGAEDAVAGARDHAACRGRCRGSPRARGRDRLAADGGERVGLGAVGASRRSRRGRGRARPARAGSCRRSAVHWSSWRHRCETLIVTRSRKASSSSGSALQARGVGGQVRRAAALGPGAHAALHLARACTGAGRRRRAGGRARRGRRSRRPATARR